MIVGQNGQPSEDRVRRCAVFGSGREKASITMSHDYVVATGGGYFFSPSVSALRDTLGS
jgi:hypothetical protein